MNLPTSFKDIKNIFINKEQQVLKAQPSVYEFIVVAGKIHHFSALKEPNEKTLLILCNNYQFKRNDKIIDQSDTSYFVETIDLNFPYECEFEGQKYKLSLQKVTYTEQPLKLPSYITNNANISSAINIQAEGSSFGDIGNILNSQQITYQTILKDLENVINNSYHIEELTKMLKEIKETVSKNKPIKENSFSRFFKFMGSQVKELLIVFISSYAFGASQK